MSFICYFVNIFLQLLFFFTYHIFLYVYILLFGKGLFEGTEMGNNAIFTYFLYTCNGICLIKVFEKYLSFILIFIIFGGITIHYNAFLAVLFLREPFYTDRKILSRFKKFPSTHGLGSTETATSCTATQVIRLRNLNDLKTQKASFETEYCIQGVF